MAQKIDITSEGADTLWSLAKSLDQSNADNQAEVRRLGTALDKNRPGLGYLTGQVEQVLSQAAAAAIKGRDASHMLSRKSMEMANWIAGKVGIPPQAISQTGDVSIEKWRQPMENGKYGQLDLVALQEMRKAVKRYEEIIAVNVEKMKKAGDLCRTNMRSDKISVNMCDELDKACGLFKQSVDDAAGLVKKLDQEIVDIQNRV
ncbi:MAG: hypothetical protein K6F35_01310 [Lachnospiraceae bacterium]|nr:hypothetical protein [Lachnospiraceae bacterium]